MLIVSNTAVFIYVYKCLPCVCERFLIEYRATSPLSILYKVFASCECIHIAGGAITIANIYDNIYLRLMAKISGDRMHTGYHTQISII